MIPEAFDRIIKHNGWADFVTPTYWDGKFAEREEKQHRVSIVTTCMDRLCNLRETLPRNIEDNRDYPDLEFVLLDYNSKDGLSNWVSENMMPHVESGLLVYCYTPYPTHYSMVHSRNVAFKLATGDVVHSVDADHYTGPGFAAYTNRLANARPAKAVFGKGKRMLRGRLGFYRREFVEELGGYDENFVGYGHDDHDILHRAYGLGYMLMYYGGGYCKLVEDHKKNDVSNFSNRWWKLTQNVNKLISCYSLSIGAFKANQHREWGRCQVVKNFSEEVLV